MKKFIFLLLLLSISIPAFAEDTVYKRVVDTDTIRCGYIVFNQFYVPAKDGKGEPQGLTVDIWKEIAKRLDVKIEWVELSNWATLYADLAAGKMDVMCHPWILYPPQLKRAIASRPIFFEDVIIYAKEKYNLTGIKTYADLNNPKYRFAGTDGELGDYLAPIYFPKAKMVLAPQGAPAGTHFQDMITGKADFIVLTPIFADAYMKSQPERIKPVIEKPLKTIPFQFPFKPGAQDFRDTINTVLEDMQREGLIDKYLKKNGLVSATAYR